MFFDIDGLCSVRHETFAMSLASLLGFSKGAKIDSEKWKTNKPNKMVHFSDFYDIENPSNRRPGPGTVDIHSKIF